MRKAGGTTKIEFWNLDVERKDWQLFRQTLTPEKQKEFLENIIGDMLKELLYDNPELLRTYAPPGLRPRVKKAKRLTSGAWLFGGQPAAKDRRIVRLDLILSGRYWKRFLNLLDGDKELAEEFFSSIIGSKLPEWVGPRVAEPDVLRDMLEAAAEKHKEGS